MDRETFLKYYKLITNKSKKLINGKVFLNSGQVYDKVKTFSFNLQNDKLYIYCLRINDRKLVQKLEKIWLINNKSLSNFNYPVYQVSINMEDIRYISYFQKVTQLTLPFEYD